MPQMDDRSACADINSLNDMMKNPNLVRGAGVTGLSGGSMAARELHRLAFASHRSRYNVS